MNKIVELLNKKINSISYNDFQGSETQSLCKNDWDNTKIYCFPKILKIKSKVSYSYILLYFMELVPIEKLGIKEYQVINIKNEDINSFFEGNNLYYITNIHKIILYTNEDNIENIKNTLLYINEDNKNTLLYSILSNESQYKNVYIDETEMYNQDYDINNMYNIKSLYYTKNNLSKPKQKTGVNYLHININDYESIYFLLDSFIIKFQKLDKIKFKDYITGYLFDNIKFIKHDELHTFNFSTKTWLKEGL